MKFFTYDNLFKFSKIVVCSSCMLLGGCINWATSAPTLPIDTTSLNREHAISANDFSPDDRALDCNAIMTEYKANQDKINADRKILDSERSSSITTYYNRGLPMFVGNSSGAPSKQQDEYETFQARQDTLTKLISFKSCKM